jgi:hypothetical protein
MMNWKHRDEEFETNYMLKQNLPEMANEIYEKRQSRCCIYLGADGVLL